MEQHGPSVEDRDTVGYSGSCTVDLASQMHPRENNCVRWELKELISPKSTLGWAITQPETWAKASKHKHLPPAARAVRVTIFLPTGQLWQQQERSHCPPATFHWAWPSWPKTKWRTILFQSILNIMTMLPVPPQVETGRQNKAYFYTKQVNTPAKLGEGRNPIGKNGISVSKMARSWCPSQSLLNPQSGDIWILQECAFSAGVIQPIERWNWFLEVGIS